jgi:hypothetical protein
MATLPSLHADEETLLEAALLQYQGGLGGCKILHTEQNLNHCKNYGAIL